MGQTLSEPVTEKHSQQIDGERLYIGVSEMQGWRLSMEDAHTVIEKLSVDPQMAFFAVFDGHGGDKVAKFAGQHVIKILTSTEEFKSGDYKNALIEAYLKSDRDLLLNSEFKGDPSGATAVSCLVTQDRLFCANAGDSRCIISVEGVAVPLSYDHKPTLPQEIQRIREAGGFVEFGRVNGNLALSRAIGDFEFKGNASLPPEKQAVTVFPDIIEHVLNESVDYMVLACDGIWDCVSNQELVNFINKRIVEGKNLQAICEDVLDWCLAPDAFVGAVGCDNMSVIIVAFLHGKSKEEWVERVKSRKLVLDGDKTVVSSPQSESPAPQSFSEPKPKEESALQ